MTEEIAADRPPEPEDAPTVLPEVVEPDEGFCLEAPADLPAVDRWVLVPAPDFGGIILDGSVLDACFCIRHRTPDPWA